MAKHSYATLPSVKRRRTRFADDWDVCTSMTVGKLTPIYLEEVVPGDDFSENISFVSRLTSSYLRPVMDDLYMDLYAFFVPGRILYDDFEGVFGNPKPSAYSDNDLGEIPTLGAGTVASKTVADYLGLPLGSVPEGVSVLPFRAFAMIWNEWFRNENTTDETFVQTGELGSFEKYNTNPWSSQNYMGLLPDVGKIKDYFTSAVPQPQKGSPVELGLASLNLKSPVYATTDMVPSFPLTGPGTPLETDLNFKLRSGGNFTLADPTPILLGTSRGKQSPVISSDTPLGSGVEFTDLSPSNLWAVQNNIPIGSVNIDQLRLATQKQLMLVADTMYGSRYREYIYGHYGVSNGDGRMQVPEFLCGKRIPLSVQQVAQTSASTEDSPLAALGGYSYTTGTRTCKYFKGFTEHGYVLWVSCIRYKHTYQQGIAKKFTRKVRDDFYDPLYAHIGYQPIYTSEIYAKGQSGLKGNIFGWTEAWSEYKHSFSAVTGETRSEATNSLDIYHFADEYSSAPVIGAQFNAENPAFFSRTLSVPTTSQDPFIIDFHCSSVKTRVMPLYCEPGYMDHWNR